VDSPANDAARVLLHCAAGEHSEIVLTLSRFGNAALTYAARHGIRIIPLRCGERYNAASTALSRMQVDVDAWPAPPAGLFVVEERAVYLRSRSAMTVAHEFGHALDCALGGGIYRSGIDPVIRRLYAAATEYVTPYAATAIDEYFAEAVRAYVEVNDPVSFWPRATKARLRRVDPQMYEYVERLFQSAFTPAPSGAADSDVVHQVK
jgi:hypothetical protein